MAKKYLNPNDIKASMSFCGLIQIAGQVFAYRLALGGMYNSTEHYEEILEHLTAVTNLIEGYESADAETIKLSI